MQKNKTKMALNRKVAPDFKQVEKIEFIKPFKFFLDNKIEVNTISGISQDLVKIDFIFSIGIWNQDKPLVASSTIKLIKEGTKSYSSYQIAEGIDSYGAFLEVENGFDSSTISLYTLNKHIDKVLPYVKEVICDPLFSENEFNIHKHNASQRFAINLEKVSFLARKEFSSLIFGNHPYSNNPSIQDYDKLSIKDIREFHNKNYGLNNLKILIAGNANDSVIKSINHFFGSEKISKNQSQENKSKYDFGNTDSLFIKKENAVQSAIRIGKIIPNKLHKDYFGLKIFNTILGGYFGSRLMNNLREDKGYTYGIGSGLISLKHAGYFFISTEVGSKVTKPALEEIYKEIVLLQTKKISEDELNLVRNYMLGQFLKSCDGAFNMANLFESVNSYGLDYSFYDNYIQTIKTITPKTIMELGVKYFNKNTLSEVVAGDIKI